MDADEPRPARPQRNVAARWASWSSSHGFLSLAIVIILIIVLIGMVAYYNGYWPFASRRTAHRKRKSSAPRDDADNESGDPVTEQLIDTINNG